MRIFLKILFTALIALTLSVPALAAETRVVPANRASAIFYYYSAASDTCYSGGKPKVNITRQPDHGSITTMWKAFRMGKEAGSCAGKPMHGMLVIYKPTPGYHGTDKVSLLFTGGASGGYFLRERGYSVNIIVK